MATFGAEKTGGEFRANRVAEIRSELFFPRRVGSVAEIFNRASNGGVMNSSLRNRLIHVYSERGLFSFAGNAPNYITVACFGRCCNLINGPFNLANFRALSAGMILIDKIFALE